MFEGLRIRRGGGFLANCSEAINETMPYVCLRFGGGLLAATVSLARHTRQLKLLGAPSTYLLNPTRAQLQVNRNHITMAPLDPLGLAWV